jgi:hypothetical protein
VVLGLGGVVNVVREFDVLDGLALSIGGSYVHVFSLNESREVREGEAPTCRGTALDSAQACPAGSARIIADRLRAQGSAALNLTNQWNLQLQYLYGWDWVKPFDDDGAVTIEDPVTGPITVDDVGDNPLPDNRLRRLGQLALSVNYQPTSWLIAALVGTTTVCYWEPTGYQWSLGGCSGGQRSADFWLRNPIANKFSTLSLQLTVPVDAVVASLTKK